ncbi:MAG TPA: ABC transporter permease [Balneolales bacterium]|nr:ABC transporter permease [Balneolales bacterium]
MIRNYFKIALRNLKRHKLYSFINIAGLSVGLTVCILILMYVQFQLSFDQFNSKSNRIYRAWEKESYASGEKHFNVATPVPLGPTLKQDIPEVEAVTRLYAFNDVVKSSNDQQATPEPVMMVDPSFLKIFDFNLLRGNKNTVFDKPNSVVITPEIAKQFFGQRDPIEQTLSIKTGDKVTNFVVSGIIKAPPANSSLQFQILIPFSNVSLFFNQRNQHSWFNVSVETYVLLNKGVTPEQLTGKLAAMMKQTLGDDYSRSHYTVGLQPLTDIHLNIKYPEAIALVSNPVYSYILAVIALLILAIVCINFMTLSISRSAFRGKEVGIRKTIGAERRQLMMQFWGEAFLVTVIGLAVSCVLATLFLPLFNQLAGIRLVLSFSWQTILIIGGSALLISLISGIYPALIISGLHPSEVLKGKIKIAGNKSFFRRGMIVLQFALSIVLIIGTIIINQQMEYVRTTDLGYKKDELVVLPSGFKPGPNTPVSKVFEEAQRRKQLLETRLNSIRGIREISACIYTPAQSSGWFNADFTDNQGQRYDFHFNVVDANFLSTIDAKMVEGRFFSKQNTSDEHRGIVVNEALVRQFGWKNPIGKRLPGPRFKNHQVIGVISDFHYQSLHTSIKPLVLIMNPDLIFSGIENISAVYPPSARYIIRLHTDNMPATITQLKQAWKEVAPAVPFEYTFVDNTLDNQYRQEEQLGNIVMWGSLLAIILACLGLFGLSVFSAQQRTKEIGIRKVLGSSVAKIVVLLSKDFLKLVGIGFLIAIPVAWFAMNRWLENFAYHIHIGPGIFLLAGAIALLIALATVSWQSIRAAIEDPVNSLRNE